jgi:hypothetical protein
MRNKAVNYIPVVSDGGISNPGIGEGRMIPVLILDCANHQEFLNLVHVHQHTPPGDVVSNWGYSLFSSRFLELNLNFYKPVELDLRIRFDLRKQAAIADFIVQAKAVYLQPAESGIRVADGLDKPKIIVEIPPSTKLRKWDAMLLTQIAKRLRSDGMGRAQSKDAAKQHLARMREFMSMRRS